MRRALKERRAHNLELAFRFLGLIYPPDDMLDSYQAVSSDLSTARANAIEFLDTILTKEEKQVFFPILERKENQIQIVREIFKKSELPIKKSFENLLMGNIPWISACAVWVVAEQNWTEYTGLIKSLRESSHPILRDTAMVSLQRLS